MPEILRSLSNWPKAPSIGQSPTGLSEGAGRRGREKEGAGGRGERGRRWPLQEAGGLRSAVAVRLRARLRWEHSRPPLGF